MLKQIFLLVNRQDVNAVQSDMKSQLSAVSFVRYIAAYKLLAPTVFPRSNAAATNFFLLLKLAAII